MEVRFVDEQSPEFLDVFDSEGDCLPTCVSFDLAFTDEEFKQVKDALQRLRMLVLASEDMLIEVVW